MPPFTVLHVCMGNICRSPMAERLLVRAVRDRAAALPVGAPSAWSPDDLLHSHSAGTGGWHAGEEMNPPAARQVRSRGANDTGFTARRLRAEHIDGADLVLTATAEQLDFVLGLRPDAAARTFLLREFGRLLAGVDQAALPPAGWDPDTIYARGVALVEAADARRAGAEPLPGDDLDDPWGRGDQWFSRVADEIEEAVDPFITLLLPVSSRQ